MQPSPAPHLQKIVLGSFRLLRVLGQGSFASAYLAEQVGTDRKAVVKIAHAHLIYGERGKMVRDRFSAEVRASTRVTHPNLVTVYTAGETDDGLPALAMEYLEGETLGQRLSRGERLTVDELIMGFAQIASALQRVHASQIIHRDLSPDNVFLTHGPDGFAIKILDFGIARLQDLESSGKYAVGTPLYMALEQMQGEAKTASDVYSVGALLWWSLTGDQLFSHVQDFTELAYQLQSQQTPPDARKHCPSLPVGVAELLASMLHHDASRRPTMASFLITWATLEPELRRWCSGRCHRQIVLLSSNPSTTEITASALRGEGHTVIQLAPKVSSLLGHPELDSVVLDAGLLEPDPVALARHLRNVLPDVQIHVVSERPFAAAWHSLGARLLALLPEQLPQLVAAIREGASFTTPHPVSSEFARLALGEIPELLAGLREDVERGDSAGVLAHCERIERISHLAALRELGSLARTMRVLTEQHAVDEPLGFVDALESGFHQSFAALRNAQNK